MTRMDLTAAFAALAEPIADAVVRRLEPVIRAAGGCTCGGGRLVKPCAPPRTAYTIREVAESLGLSARQVYRLAESGELPTRRIGGKLLVPAKALDELLAHAELKGEGLPSR